MEVFSTSRFSLPALSSGQILPYFVEIMISFCDPTDLFESYAKPEFVGQRLNRDPAEI